MALVNTVIQAALAVGATGGIAGWTETAMASSTQRVAVAIEVTATIARTNISRLKVRFAVLPNTGYTTPDQVEMAGEIDVSLPLLPNKPFCVVTPFVDNTGGRLYTWLEVPNFGGVVANVKLSSVEINNT